MAFVVEDGSGVPGANAGITPTFLAAYATDRNRTVPGGDTQSGIVRGTAAISALYGSLFPGVRTYGRAQGLPWPRTGASDNEGRVIGPNEMPIEYREAVAEATLREMAIPGSILPDVAAGGAVKRKKLGAMEVELAVSDGAAAPGPRLPFIDAILAPLLPGPTAGIFAMVV